MKCDHCENEATVHEWTKAGGQRHMCEACALKAGLPVQSQTQFSQIVAQSIASLLKPGAEQGVKPGESESVAGAPASGSGEPTSKPLAACPSCALELGQFRSTGLLGCPECYRAFESVLGPLIERSHEGATHHTGKTPRLSPRPLAVGVDAAKADYAREERVWAGVRAEREKRLEALRRQLAAAVQSEQYERAARLRDEIALVEQELTGTEPSLTEPTNGPDGSEPGEGLTGTSAGETR